MVEIKCEKCGAVYEVNGAVPNNMKCLCNSRDFKKCK
jgi:hypothetical protein